MFLVNTLIEIDSHLLLRNCEQNTIINENDYQSH